MCGIAGIFAFKEKIKESSLIDSMTDIIFHRGPDSGKTYIKDNVALGHRRLSIIDLSEKANQPLFSDEGDIVIAYNGEVYNFLEIKEKLLEKGYKFKTTSDTEVVLKAYQEFGVEAFKMLNGMYGLSIYDSKKKALSTPFV